jgi:Methyltransferase domain
MLKRLPTVVPPDPDRPDIAGADHPMRAVTRQIAFEPGGWTPERRAKVAELFDTLAPGWNERDAAGRHDGIADALDRGGPFSSAPCLELGSGTGAHTREMTAHFDEVVCVDVSFEMLRRAPADLAPRVQADSSQLPFADGAVGTAVLINMFLFPAELDRVLAPDGAVVWVSSLGDGTPIYLDAAEVEAALPGDWDGVAAAAGWGTWAVFRRAGSTMPS